jgi:hypothetical protein
MSKRFFHSSSIDTICTQKHCAFPQNILRDQLLHTFTLTRGVQRTHKSLLTGESEESHKCVVEIAASGLSRSKLCHFFNYIFLQKECIYGPYSLFAATFTHSCTTHATRQRFQSCCRYNAPKRQHASALVLTFPNTYTHSPAFHHCDVGVSETLFARCRNSFANRIKYCASKSLRQMSMSKDGMIDLPVDEKNYSCKKIAASAPRGENALSNDFAVIFNSINNRHTAPNIS